MSLYQTYKKYRSRFTLKFVFITASHSIYAKKYVLGGTKKQRLNVDITLYKYMLYDTMRLNYLYRLYWQIWATIYFLLMRLIGKRYWNAKK